MSSFMQANDIRQAALAVVRGRRLAYARGYTFAEAGWRTTQPTTFFRTASVSKVVTAVEIMRMVERGDITLNTTVQSILNLRTPSGGNPNARFAGITINDLLTHNYSTLGGDCLAENPAVDQAVAKAFQVKLPVTQMQSARFMVGSANLFWTPGAGDRCYSNFGYTLLSMVVANRRGSFWSALQTDVLGPLAIKRARVSSSDATLNTTSEALYQTDGLDVVFDVNRSNSPLALEAYGEANHAVTFAAGGLSFAAPDLVRILAMLNMRGSNNPVFRNRQTIGTALTNGTLGFEQSITDTIPGTHYIKGGFMAGLQSNAYFTSGVKNGLSYVVLFARDGIPRPGAGANFYPTWSNLETALLAPASNLSGRQDFFPTYGMPSLPNDPAIPCTMDSQCMAPDICWDGVCTIPVGP
jgi:CubicO group peptidase (beta-lactamase class C family)